MRRLIWASGLALGLNFCLAPFGCSDGGSGNPSDGEAPPNDGASFDAGTAGDFAADARTTLDGAVGDLGTHDLAALDQSASIDANATPDAAGADVNCTVTTLMPADGGVPMLLSETGLYSDIADGILSPDVEEFHPAYALWSDGAVKRRWVSIPPCTTIDTSDMDHWVFPVGTRFWKEFVVDGKRVETRLIARTGPRASDWMFGAYQWNDANTEATFVPDGVVNASGTPHDIPSVGNCIECHGNLIERILGFSAIQLSHGGSGVTLDELAAAGRLSKPPSIAPAVPGNSEEQAALGWLHANCGHCHNPTGVQFPMHPFELRLLVGETSVAMTGAIRTAVGVPVENIKQNITNPNILLRISPGHSGDSCVPYRDGQRGTKEQMPPLATKIIDPAGVAAVTKWVDDL